jgi:hypothetical protein
VIFTVDGPASRNYGWWQAWGSYLQFRCGDLDFSAAQGGVVEAAQDDFVGDSPGGPGGDQCHAESGGSAHRGEAACSSST